MQKTSTAAQPSPLPGAPMMWAHPEEINDGPSPGFFGADGFSAGFLGGGADFEGASFADIALADDDFDAPVYRSLGGVFGADATAGLDLASEDESPRYRSFGGVPEDAPMSADEADRAWLASMPPLVRRQPAMMGMQIP